MRRARAEVPPDIAAAHARAAAREFLGLAEVEAASRVALYAARPGELSTRPLFDALRAAGRICLLPVIVGPRCPLEFRIVSAWEDLAPGRYGVLEPTQCGETITLQPSDLALVPGLAFDPDGRRVGSGAGYYDRTFPLGRPAPLLVGYAFHLQRVARVPSAPHDRAMDVIVTERGAFRASAEQG